MSPSVATLFGCVFISVTVLHEQMLFRFTTAFESAVETVLPLIYHSLGELFEYSIKGYGIAAFERLSQTGDHFLQVAHQYSV